MALFEGLIIGGSYFRRSLSAKGNLRFQIHWASLMVGSKFTVFALFYVVFESNFQVQAPGGLYLEGPFSGCFFFLKGLIHGADYFLNLTLFSYRF